MPCPTVATMTSPTGSADPAGRLRLPVALLGADRPRRRRPARAGERPRIGRDAGPRRSRSSVEVPAGPGLPDTDRPRHHAVPAGDHPGARRCWSRTGSAARRRRSTPTPARWPPAGSSCSTWTARGFGASGGQIALDSPDYEVADARALVDRLAARPEVVQDGPGDPRVGVTGGSYGGALALLLAGYDPRIDALAPVITWNDLGQALFPNAAAAPAALPADTPARGAFAPDGVFKRGWAGVFFSAGLAPGGGPGGAVEGATDRGGPAPPHRPAAPHPTCPPPAAGFTPPSAPPTPRPPPPAGSPPPPRRCCAAPPPPRSRTGSPRRPSSSRARRTRCSGSTRPTPPPARSPRPAARCACSGTAAATTAARRTSASATRSAPGSTTGSPAAAPTPATAFGYTVASGVRTGGDTPTSRTVEAPAYPGLGGGPGRVHRRRCRCEGEPQVALVPAGGNPAAITSLPGLGGALGTVGNRVAAFTARAPRASPRVFRTAPVAAPLLVAGAPRVDLAIARVPGQPAPDEAVLFAKVYEIASDGTRTLLGGAVSPVRVAVPADGSSAQVAVTLPGVVAPIEAGNRLMVSVGTTDQGFAGTTTPAVWRIGLGGADAGAGALRACRAR